MSNVSVTAGGSAVLDRARPDEECRTVPVPSPSKGQQLITALLIGGPIVAVIVAVATGAILHVTIVDVVLFVAFFLITGHGLSAGFHRMFTHRSFKAKRWLKITFGVVGSLAMEGSLISWVANHRRHHAYTDKAGDPHSPHEYGDGTWNQIRSVVHAQVGWLFRGQLTEEGRWAPDLIKDRDLVAISRLFPLFVVASLGIPMFIGWAITGTWAGALGGLIWGGLIRVFAVHQVTFSVNSTCHLWGSRPFKTRSGDQSTNSALLSIVAMGESWHNLHHSCPTLARHGVDRHQFDSTARLIWLLERCGAASDAKWPVAALLDERRITPISGAA